jgi:hypothetical protein
MVRKAQGALEFLMTYGWAFLVILIMIGALAYFGVLNPNRFLPDRCTFGSQIICKTDQMVINNEVQTTLLAVVTNNFGGDVRLYDGDIDSDVTALGDVDATCNLCFTTISTGVCIEPASDLDAGPDWIDDNAGDVFYLHGEASGGPAPSTNAVIWPEGESRLISIGCDNAASLSEGTKIKFVVKMKYYFTSSTAAYSKDISGDVFASVQ